MCGYAGLGKFTFHNVLVGRTALGKFTLRNAVWMDKQGWGHTLYGSVSFNVPWRALVTVNRQTGTDRSTDV